MKIEDYAKGLYKPLDTNTNDAIVQQINYFLDSVLPDTNDQSMCYVLDHKLPMIDIKYHDYLISRAINNVDQLRNNIINYKNDEGDQVGLISHLLYVRDFRVMDKNEWLIIPVMDKRVIIKETVRLSIDDIKSYFNIATLEAVNFARKISNAKFTLDYRSPNYDDLGVVRDDTFVSRAEVAAMIAAAINIYDKYQ